jgi:hypothetical protein
MLGTTEASMVPENESITPAAALGMVTLRGDKSMPRTPTESAAVVVPITVTVCAEENVFQALVGNPTAVTGPENVVVSSPEKTTDANPDASASTSKTNAVVAEPVEKPYNSSELPLPEKIEGLKMIPGSAPPVPVQTNEPSVCMLPSKSIP